MIKHAFYSSALVLMQNVSHAIYVVWDMNNASKYPPESALCGYYWSATLAVLPVFWMALRISDYFR